MAAPKEGFRRFILDHGAVLHIRMHAIPHG